MKDNKKKVMILVALFVVILSVGVFQFTSSGSAPAPKPEAKKESAVEAEATNEEGAVADKVTADDPLKQLYASNMPVRDPFTEVSSALRPIDNGAVKPPVQQPQPQPSSQRKWSPPPMGGDIPPFNPNAGGGLPSLNSGVGAAPVNIEPERGYSVQGVLRGPKNSAVITDPAGNQRLVTEGQSLDGDTKVIAIREGKVVLQRKGKTQTLNVGGNP